MSETGHPLRTGRRVGAYVLGPLLGAGGMGEVYRAHDTRLGRDVAIKILPADFTTDRDRLVRFEREARVLARLNHPHIASIFGVEEAGDERALVLELVEGETLAATIARGALPVDTLLESAISLADAIAAAHEKGVTHRDLKPGNVMVRADGRIKVLDFGIAKLRSETAAGATSLTEAGRVLGTAAYMSPEQATGGAVDHRSDLFSLGAVLYEMATGVQAFAGETQFAQMAAVLTAAPAAPTRERPDLPPGLDAIILRALEKDPARRYQTAEALREDLEALRLTVLRDPRAGRRLLWVSGLVGGTVAIAAGIALSLRSASDAVATVSGAMQVTWEEGIEATPSLSPDGRRIAYEHAGDILVHDLEDGTAINLTPDSPAFDGEPAFSPDGRQIAFSSRRDGGEVRGGIWIVDVNGGPARRLTNAGFSPSWSPDGAQLVYASEFVRGDARPTHRVRISTLRAVQVRQGITRLISDGDVAQPAWSPHGHRIAFWQSFEDGRPTRFTIMTMRPDGTDVVAVTDGQEFPLSWNPVWSPDGRYVYFCTLRDGSASVWRVAVDERSGRVLGEATPVPLPARMVRHVALATNGAIAWEASLDEANVHRIAFDTVVGLVPDAVVPVTRGSRLWLDVDVSTDGRLVMTSDPEPSNLWVSNGDGAGLAPLFADRMHSRQGRWSPDGGRIAFTSAASGTLETWTVEADGTDLVRVSHFGNDGAGFFPIWSPDGTRLAITTGVMFGGETFLVDPARPWQEQTLETLRPPPGDPSLRYRPWSWSPDGRRIAAYSERGAGIAVYALETRSWDVITSTGSMPRWLGDSRRLVYEDGGSLRIVDTATRQSRTLLTVSGSSLQSPALAPADAAIYFIRTRLEREIWIGTVL